MTVPWWVLIAAGCVAYLIVGFFIAMVFTIDGPPQRWKRVGWRLLLLFGWLPTLVLTPFIGVIRAVFS